MEREKSDNLIGKNIAEILYVKRKKQKWLAQQCKVTSSHISQIINGKSNPSIQLLSKIARNLDVSLSDITNEYCLSYEVDECNNG